MIESPVIEVRCLTVRQPWAWAIAHGGKDVENRTGGSGRWSYRGWLAIHAGEGWSEPGRSDPRMVKAWFGAAGRPGVHALPRPERLCNRPSRLLDTGALVFGQVVAIVDLVDAHDASPGCCSSRWAEESYVDASGCRRSQVTHLVLASRFAVEPTLPVWHGGRLGIWRPDAELAEELSATLLALR